MPLTTEEGKNSHSPYQSGHEGKFLSDPKGSDCSVPEQKGKILLSGISGFYSQQEHQHTPVTTSTFTDYS